MEEVTTRSFCDEIATNHNIDPTKKVKSYFKDFPIKNGKRKISAFYDSIIVDAHGNEYPYMINQNIRNNEKLDSFEYIYTIQYKNLTELISESNAKVKVSPCKVCEGGGWYSSGNRYEYNGMYCEI